jgi:hypothetical protein
VAQSTGYEFIHALHGYINILWLGKIPQLLHVSAPNLAKKEGQKQVNACAGELKTSREVCGG